MWRRAAGRALSVQHPARPTGSPRHIVSRETAQQPCRRHGVAGRGECASDASRERRERRRRRRHVGRASRPRAPTDVGPPRGARDARLRARRAHRGDSRRRRRRSRTGFPHPILAPRRRRPDSRGEGGGPAGLRFIHIPKTGGTTIESVASDNGADSRGVKQQRTAATSPCTIPPWGTSSAPCTTYPGRIRPGLFLRQAQPVHRAVSQFLHVVDHPDASSPNATPRTRSTRTLVRQPRAYINLRLNRVENNRLVPCLMRDAETDFASRGARRERRRRGRTTPTREKAERKTNARADANETPERKTEAETVSAVREARLPAKKAEVSCRNANPRRHDVARRSRDRGAARRERDGDVFSVSSAASCDAPSRASWSWMDHWEGPHLTAHGGDDCHTLPQFLHTSRCEHVLAFERFDEEVMPPRGDCARSTAAAW